MWRLVTEDGSEISERGSLWPSVPADVRVREFWYRDRLGVEGKVDGFDAYGFQRYSTVSPAAELASGAQILAVIGDVVTVIDIDDATGQRSVERLPLAQMTYDRRLLRDGVRQRPVSANEAADSQ